MAELFRKGDRVMVPKDEPEHMRGNPSFCGSEGTVLGYVDGSDDMVRVDYDGQGMRHTWERCLVRIDNDLELELTAVISKLFKQGVS